MGYWACDSQWEKASQWPDQFTACIYPLTRYGAKALQGVEGFRLYSWHMNMLRLGYLKKTTTHDWVLTKNWKQPHLELSFIMEKICTQHSDFECSLGCQPSWFLALEGEFGGPSIQLHAGFGELQGKPYSWESTKTNAWQTVLTSYSMKGYSIKDQVQKIVTQVHWMFWSWQCDTFCSPFQITYKRCS